MNIYLIGYRGTGKSTVGMMLGEMLDLSYYDTDDEIVNSSGKSIADIVAREGWDSFREKERQVLRDISFGKRMVVSTGGGIVLDRSNIAEMRKAGVVVWLRAEAGTIIDRIRGDRGSSESRPSLAGGTLEDEVKETLLKRMSLYERSMDFFVETDHRGLEEICLEVIEVIKSRGVSI